MQSVASERFKLIFQNRKKEEKIMENKKLYRSSTNSMLAGVCGGIGEYFNIDPTLVRLAWVLFSVLGGAGVLAYIIAAIIIPSEANVRW